jgi:hypothetical protein
MKLKEAASGGRLDEEPDPGRFKGLAEPQAAV